MSNQKILGIDPGTHRLGWGIIEGTASQPQLVDCGCLEFPPSTPASGYLLQIHQFLTSLLTEHEIETAGIEKLFAQHNQTTVISVAQARGVLLLTLAEHGVPYREFSPNTIKSAVAGSGSAGKLEVARMVRLLLGLGQTKLRDDTTDALAIAITTLTIKL